MRSKETNASEPLMTCRKRMDDVKTGDDRVPRDQSGRRPAYCPDGIRHEGGVTLVQALARNMGTCRLDAKGETQGGGPSKGESTDARHGGGVVRSSDESSVMEPERRGGVIKLYSGINRSWEESRG